MSKSNRLPLSDDEKSFLDSILRKGSHPARLMRRCQILLKAGQGLSNKAIAEHVSCSVASVNNVRKRFLEGGLDRALYDAPRPGAPAKFSEEQIAQILALANEQPPRGSDRWTVELLCQEAASRGIVASISIGRMHSLLKEYDQAGQTQQQDPPRE